MKQAHLIIDKITHEFLRYDTKYNLDTEIALDVMESRGLKKMPIYNGQEITEGGISFKEFI